MKTRLFTFCMIFVFIVSTVRGQRPFSINYAKWTDPSGEISIRWDPSADLYFGVPNRILVETYPKQSIAVKFSNGLVKKLNDSVFELTPKVKTNTLYSIDLIGKKTYHVTCGDIINLPDPDIFYLKGGPYDQDENKIIDILKSFTIKDLMQNSKIEARYRNYIFKIKEFKCKIFERADKDEIYAYFKSDTISTEFLRSLKIAHHPLALLITNIKLTAPDSSERIIAGDGKYQFITEIYRDSSDLLLGKYLANHVGTYNRAKSDVRISLEGNPGKEDILTVKKVIGELNPLLGTIKLKLVKTLPSLIIKFDTPDSVHGEGTITSSTSYYGCNRFFPLLSNEIIYIYINATNQKDRDLILWKEITRSLCQFVSFNGNEPVVSTIIGQNKESGLTHEDKIVLKTLFSAGSEKLIEKLKEKQPTIPQINILLSILISIVFFFCFYEIYNFYNLARIFRNQVAQKILSALLISQLALAAFYIFKAYNNLDTRINFSFLHYEMYTCSFAVVASLFFNLADSYAERLKLNWLRLSLNPVITLLSLYLAYQVIYLFVRAEFLRFITIDINALTIGLSIATVRFYLYFENTKIAGLMKDKELELVKQREMINRAELNALQARINPHFLYNALNSIAALAHIDPKRTENMALSISKLFRYNVNREEQSLSSLGQEIEMVQLYLEIEKQRFGEKLNFSINADAGLYDRQIPRFLIQPLVENSIKHGISKLKEEGKIILKVYADGQNLFIEVYDNGPVFPEGLISGYGLQNMYDKLNLIYKKAYEVRFVNHPEKFIQIKL